MPARLCGRFGGLSSVSSLFFGNVRESGAVRSPRPASACTVSTSRRAPARTAPPRPGGDRLPACAAPPRPRDDRRPAPHHLDLATIAGLRRTTSTSRRSPACAAPPRPRDKHQRERHRLDLVGIAGPSGTASPWRPQPARAARPRTDRDHWRALHAPRHRDKHRHDPRTACPIVCPQFLSACPRMCPHVPPDSGTLTRTPADVQRPIFKGN